MEYGDTMKHLVPAVGYLRRSTHKQEKSIADQRREIERYAAKHGYQIICCTQMTVSAAMKPIPAAPSKPCTRMRATVATSKLF